jgi:hypothetical protein
MNRTTVANMSESFWTLTYLIEEYDISRYQGLVKVDNVALDVDSTTEWCRTKKLVLSSNEIP